MGHQARLHFLSSATSASSSAVRRMRQMAASGDLAALAPAASTVPWATCSAVRTLFVALFITNSPSRTPEASAQGTLREALVWAWLLGLWISVTLIFMITSGRTPDGGMMSRCSTA